MNALYHRTKHWVLFILTTGIPMIAYFAWLFSFIAGFTMFEYEPDFEDFNLMFAGLGTYLALTIIAQLVYYGWMWSAGVGLQKYLPEALRMKTTFFKVTIIYPAVFLVLYLGFFIWLFSVGFGIMETWDSAEPDFNFNFFILFFLMFPLGLFAVFCAFYAFWFAGKTVKTMELQREVKFGEFVGEFFLFWFYFVGVWIIQPKINKIAAGNP